MLWRYLLLVLVLLQAAARQANDETNIGVSEVGETALRLCEETLHALRVTQE